MICRPTHAPTPTIYARIHLTRVPTHLLRCWARGGLAVFADTVELLPAELAPAQVRARHWSSQTAVPRANLNASPQQGAFSVCAQFRSAGHPSLPTPAPPAVHRAVLARVAGQQAAEAGFAQPMPGAAASADGSILVTCAFVGGRRVAFPREIIVEGFPLRLAAAGHAVGIDTSVTPATDSAKGSVAFAMCPADGGRCFVLLAPVTSCALRVTEALPGLQRCAAPAGCTNRVVGDDLDALEVPVSCWRHSA